MPYLTPAQIDGALAALAAAGLDGTADRGRLLAGVPAAVVGHLDVLAQPRLQLRSDLSALNAMREPWVRQWLGNAAALLGPRAAARVAALGEAAWFDDAAVQPVAPTLALALTGSRPLVGPEDPLLRPANGRFLGRDPHVEALLADLEAGHPVHLVGPGGVGKTELARATLRAWLGAAGRCGSWVTLAGVEDAVGLAAALADGAGDPRAADAEAALQAVARAPGLYCLADLDRVADDVGAMALVARLLDIPGVRLLTTAAAAPPLPGETHPLAGLPPDAALALFDAAWTDAGSSPPDSAAVRAFAVDTLGGHPLSIELAARLDADLAALSRRWAREGPDPLDQALRLTLRAFGDDRRIRLLWTLAALWPEGLDPAALAWLEQQGTLRPADREAALGAHLVQRRDDHLTVQPAVGRFALAAAEAGRDGFSLRGVLDAARGWFEALATQGADPPTRGQVLALHRHLHRVHRAASRTPPDAARDARALDLLVAREPLLAREALRTWAAGPPSPFQALCGLRLMALHVDLGDATEPAAGDPLTELAARVEAAFAALQARDTATFERAAEQAAVLAARGEAFLWRRLVRRFAGPLQALGWRRRRLPPSLAWHFLVRPLGLAGALAAARGDESPAVRAAIARLDAHPSLVTDPTTLLRLAWLNAAAGDAGGAVALGRLTARRAAELHQPLAQANALVLEAATARPASPAPLEQAIALFGRLGHHEGAARAAAMLSRTRPPG